MKKEMTRDLRMTSRRAGAVLVQFALLSVAFVAIMAVALDISLLRNVQGAMEGATDVAALEGLRMRDAASCPPTMTLEECIRYRDLERRRAASEAMALNFDEDFDLATRNEDHRYGFGGFLKTHRDGGPVAEPFAPDGPAAEMAPDALEETLDAYNPYEGGNNPIEFNHRDNHAYGDMVSGSFKPTQARFTGQEAWDYAREDFVPATAAQSGAQDSFLVRVRRGNNPAGFDNVSGVSSTGPQIPALFSLGAMIKGTPGTGYDPRRDGFTVRSSSIADTRPVVAVGLADPLGAYPGAPNLGLDSEGSIRTLALDGYLIACSGLANTTRQLEIRSDGSIDIEGGEAFFGACNSFLDIGRVLSLVDSETGIVTYGNSIRPQVGAIDVNELQLYWLRTTYYLPLIRSFRPTAGDDLFESTCSDITAASDECFQVVGFMAMEVTGTEIVDSDGDGNLDLLVSFQLIPGYIAPQNASATNRRALAAFAASPTNVTGFRKHLESPPPSVWASAADWAGPLLAPVLVR